MTMMTNLKVDDGEDDSAVDELEFDLNQLREARPDLAPENLDADELVDFDRGSNQRILTIACRRNCYQIPCTTC